MSVNETWPMALFVMLCGPVAGSFLGVVVDRWPVGRSLWTPSQCDSCAARLRWRDLVPVLTGLRGRCRICGAKIPGHLLRIELAALGASTLAVLLAQTPAEMLLLACYLFCLVGLFYADLLHFRLPDPFTATLALTGLLLAALDPNRGLWDGALSGVIGAGAFYVIRVGYQLVRGREGLGLGDVKLMAGIGAGLGWPAVPVVALIGACLALLVTLIETVKRRSLPSKTTALPFGAYLAAAAVLTLIL